MFISSEWLWEIQVSVTPDGKLPYRYHSFYSNALLPPKASLFMLFTVSFTILFFALLSYMQKASKLSPEDFFT